MTIREVVRAVGLRPRVRQPRWLTSYAGAAALADALAMLLAIACGHFLGVGSHGSYVDGLPLVAVTVVSPFVWLAALALSRAYEPAVLGSGIEEYKRIGSTMVRLTALGALLVYVVNAHVARGFVLVVLPAAWLFTVGGRWLARRPLHAGRRRGRFHHRVLVIGPSGAAEELARVVDREPWSGLSVVAGIPLPEAIAPNGIERALQAWEVDTVAIAPGLGSAEVRTLAWRLEGTGADLVVTPSLTNVAGPRVHIRPVSGLPLLYVDSPEDRYGGQPLKLIFDRVAAAAVLLLLSPLLLAVTLLIKLTSSGPALFRQARWGYRGQQFSIFKFRTMVDGADSGFGDLVEASGSEHGMFVKDCSDPRVTPVGRWLRRFSIDELPQLLNVVRGEMSLVGPRPLPIAVLHNAEEARRRFLVRPGMTGLWQVSGRSDLPVEEAIRLDLYYVENWSFGFDLQILWRTLHAVVGRDGAY